MKRTGDNLESRGLCANTVVITNYTTLTTHLCGYLSSYKTESKERLKDAILLTHRLCKMGVCLLTHSRHI